MPSKSLRDAYALRSGMHEFQITALYLIKEHPKVEKGEKILVLVHFSGRRREERAHRGGGENRRLNRVVRIVPSLENSMNEVH
jgi:hypothetical protein